jgi:hypothetical protein
MEFMLLIGICVLVIAWFAWLGVRRRQIYAETPVDAKERSDLDRRTRGVNGAGGPGGGW